MTDNEKLTTNPVDDSTKDPTIPAVDSTVKKLNHKKLIALIITAIAVLCAAGYIVLKNKADSIAADYQKSISSSVSVQPLYQEEDEFALEFDPDTVVDNTVSKENLDTYQRQVKKAEKAITTLPSSPLGSMLSSDYKKALDVQREGKRYLESAKKLASNAVNSAAYHEAFEAAYDVVRAPFTDNEDILDKKASLDAEIKKIEAVVLFGEDKKVQIEAVRIYKKISDLYQKIEDAVRTLNQANVTAAQQPTLALYRELRQFHDNESKSVGTNLRDESEAVAKQAKTLVDASK